MFSFHFRTITLSHTMKGEYHFLSIWGFTGSLKERFSLALNYNEIQYSVTQLATSCFVFRNTFVYCLAGLLSMSIRLRNQETILWQLASSRAKTKQGLPWSTSATNWSVQWCSGVLYFYLFCFVQSENTSVHFLRSHSARFKNIFYYLNITVLFAGQHSLL